jgi:N-acetylglucosaminyldiphosphoundecaprenol N-acetyl-beta-D-mannosaminyltransferase
MVWMSSQSESQPTELKRRVSAAVQFRVLSSPVDEITLPEMQQRIRHWTKQPQSRYVCIADVHSIMRARHDPLHADALLAADAVTPDGTPLVAVGRIKGRNVARVCGPDLMEALCAAPRADGYRHFFYGSTPEILDALVKQLKARFPEIDIVGQLSPARWNLEDRDWSKDLQPIKAAAPNILWVGLGCPKQERWMAINSQSLPGVVMIGVGAAFDFHAGSVRRAPVLMQRTGLEWLHRVTCEPRRLLRRYAIIVPKFLLFALADVAQFHWARAVTEKR